MDSLKISMYGLNKSLYKQAKLGNLPIQTLLLEQKIPTMTMGWKEGEE